MPRFEFLVSSGRSFFVRSVTSTTGVSSSILEVSGESSVPPAKIWRMSNATSTTQCVGRIMRDLVSKADPSPEGISDRSLIRRLRTGSQDAATQLYLRYAKRLRGLSLAKTSIDLASRFDSDDIVQSVFRTFFRRVGNGDYDVPDGEDLWKLFLVIGLNKIRTAATYNRAAKRDVRALLGGKAFQAALNSAMDDGESSLTILRISIEEILESLSPSHREILSLRIEGHEVKEIAERVGRSKRSVERILQQFRSQMVDLVREDH